MTFALFCSLASSCGYGVEIVPDPSGLVSHVMRPQIAVKVYEREGGTLLIEHRTVAGIDDAGECLEELAPRLLREWTIRTRQRRAALPSFPQVPAPIGTFSERPVAEDEET